MRFFVLYLCTLLSMAVFCSGCNKTSVRDAKVYNEELNFFDAASEEVVERGKKVIALNCKCSNVSGNISFTTKECKDFADTLLVLEARVNYHTDMMRFNGGLIDNRPPKNPPDIPVSNTLCPSIDNKDGGM
jgi:hypothetical protein